MNQVCIWNILQCTFTSLHINQFHLILWWWCLLLHPSSMLFREVRHRDKKLVWHKTIVERGERGANASGWPNLKIRDQHVASLFHDPDLWLQPIWSLPKIRSAKKPQRAFLSSPRMLSGSSTSGSIVSIVPAVTSLWRPKSPPRFHLTVTTLLEPAAAASQQQGRCHKYAPAQSRLWRVM